MNFILSYHKYKRVLGLRILKTTRYLYVDSPLGFCKLQEPYLPPGGIFIVFKGMVGWRV